MEWLHAILLIVGAILAVSALIVAKAPDARAVIDKLVPFQALIGVGLLAVSVVQLLRGLKFLDTMKDAPVPGLAWLAGSAGGIVLGFLFGMPQIAKMIPGDSPAEQKAQELSRKVAPYQVIIGVICGGAGILMLLLLLKIMKPY
ncbi:MAG TPA: hypothetical protein VM513_32130 [Kofleriaceae bacterium]|jgi:hypothetical protein|nr:hypothetical protein [Kofleriaceae bacterium]